MSQRFIGELRIFSFGFAPQNWAMCNGQLLPINQNAALFSLLGTTYGGDGRVNFALPDLRGRTPISRGVTTQGTRAGEESHTLTPSEMPAHNHFVSGTTSPADATTPLGNMLGAGAPTTFQTYANTTAGLTTMQPASITNVGASQPHNNLQPYSVLNVCIALTGIFPSRS